MFEIVYYHSARGEKFVRDFIDILSTKAQQKVFSRLLLLEEHGPNLMRPYADYLKDKLYELRILVSKHNIRIIYFFYNKNQIVLLHGFKKKQMRIDAKDLSLAHNRMRDWIRRNEGVKFKYEI